MTEPLPWNPGNGNGTGMSARRWVAPLAVAAAAVVAYANTLTLGFTLDDFTIIVDNPRIGDPEWLLSLFLKPMLWRPLKRLSLGIDFRIWGLAHPAGFHATNIALHAAACVALWAVALRLGLRRGAALAAALLFAVHPVHVEAVANISHRKESMALLFSLLGFLAYLRGREKRPGSGPFVRAGWVAAAALAYLCGMLSKEVGAVMLPFAIVAYEALVARDALRARAARLARFLPALGLVVLLFTIRGYIGTLATRFQPDQIRWITGKKASDYGMVVRIALKAFGESVGMLVRPWPLYFDRAFELPTSVYDRGVVLGCVALLGFLAALAASARRAPVACFALAWFGLFLLPVSGVVPLTYWYVAERFLYAPSAGIALLVGIGVERVWSAEFRGRAVARSALLAVLVCLTGMTVVQNRVWRDQESLYAHTLRYNPDSFRALYGLGLVRDKAGKRAAAEELYRASIRSAPDYGEPYYALALLRLQDGSLEEAIALAKEAAKWLDDDPQPLVLLGNACLEADRLPEAVDAYRRAHELDPEDADILFNLAAALEASGDLDGALRALDDAIALDPTGPVARAARQALADKINARKSVERPSAPSVR